MHVVIAGWLLSNEPSGVNRRMLATLRALPPLLDRGERITVLHGPDHEPEPTAGIDWVRSTLPAGPAWRRALSESARLPRLLRDLGAAVFEQGFLPLARRIPCRTCLTLHDLRDLGPFRRHNALLSRVAIRSGAARAGAIIVPSEAVRRELNSLFKTPVHVVPGGVERVAGERKQAGRPRFLHVGHLEPRKNLEILVRALTPFPEANLALVGQDAGCGQELMRLATELRVAHRIGFLGVLDDEELADEYRTCTALVFPSLLEGFGLPVLEAMSHGAPVLASDRASLPEVVGTAGRVLPANDPNAWATAMRECWEQRQDHNGAVERAHAATFSWQRCARETLQVWRGIAAATPQPTSVMAR